MFGAIYFGQAPFAVFVQGPQPTDLPPGFGGCYFGNPYFGYCYPQTGTTPPPPPPPGPTPSPGPIFLGGSGMVVTHTTGDWTETDDEIMLLAHVMVQLTER